LTSEVTTTRPRDGVTAPTGLHETAAADVDTIVEAAAAARPGWNALGRTGRAAAMRAVAAAYEEHHDELVALADEETALGETRLRGDVARTINQLRYFADIAEDGSWLEATVDHAGDTITGPRPDMRRMLVPLGVVAVFGASNVPFSYAVVGGDTASALAAGNTVVVKGHPAHPRLAQRCAEVAAAALVAAGAPEGTLGLVLGQHAGTQIVQHPAVKAVGFTGSLAGGTFLFNLASSRRDPIPFYGELGSINPMVVTESAAAERATAIAEGLVTSITTAMGQACTKPGLVFVPDSEAGAHLASEIGRALADAVPGWLLTDGIRAAYEAGIAEMTALPGVEVLGRGPVENGGFAVPAAALAVDVRDLQGRLLEECFGPAVVVVRVPDEDATLAALAHVEGSLTGAIHCGDDDIPHRVADALVERVGRLVWNAFPTGLPIAWATQHGGPFPASIPSVHTSVGATAIRRFVRPVTWQDAPQAALPAELRDGEVDVPRRVDGVVQNPLESVVGAR